MPQSRRRLAKSLVCILQLVKLLVTAARKSGWHAAASRKYLSLSAASSISGLRSRANNENASSIPLLHKSKLTGRGLVYAEKLSPQEQCATAFGFETLKPPFWRSSLKSSSDPLTKQRALRIDDHPDLVGLHKDIAVRGAIDQIHLILQSRAAASDHRHTQGPVRATLPLQQGTQLRARGIRTRINLSLPIL